MVFQVPLHWWRNNLRLQLKSGSVFTQTLSWPMPAEQLHAKIDFQTYQVNCERLSSAWASLGLVSPLIGGGPPS